MKKTVKETVREYDAEGKLVKEVVTETTEETVVDINPVWPGFQPITNPSITWCYDTTATRAVNTGLEAFNV